MAEFGLVSRNVARIVRVKTYFLLRARTAGFVRLVETRFSVLALGSFGRTRSGRLALPVRPFRRLRRLRRIAGYSARRAAALSICFTVAFSFPPPDLGSEEGQLPDQRISFSGIEL